MKEPIRVGFIGYGMAARVFHAPVIGSLPELRLKTVVERHGDDSRRDHPHVGVVRDADALLQDEEIDLVVVATPNDTHFDLARRALVAGKHVVVEKPFAATSDAAQQLIDLARRQERIISVHQNRRWDGDFKTVRKILEGKLLGRVVEYESRYDRFRNHRRENAWREAETEGSGILFDIGSHLIDQAQVLFGLPRAITADIRAQRGFGKVDDSFELILDYEDLKATLRAGMLVRERGPRFTLHGTEGSYVKHGFDPQEESLKRGLTPSAANWGEEPPERWGMLNTQLEGLHVRGRLETLAGSYQDFYRNVCDAIAGRAELAVTPVEARNTIRIIELAVRSNEQKRTVTYST
jgi:predicted dehydrogenase